MRLFGFDFTLKRPGSAQPSGGWQLRPTDGQGPYTKYFQSFVPREIDAEFYEFLREAIPIIDGGIRRLTSLDGHLTVHGDNQALVDEIRDWMDNVPVNDGLISAGGEEPIRLQRGLQAFHTTLSNEGFEQGFALGEFVTDASRRDIVQLRVADSKFIRFRRKAAGLEVLQKADEDHDWRPLKPGNLLYWSIDNEAQNPYGTSIMRSMEFVSKILATIHNATLNVWERFGDPSFEIIYKTAKRDQSIIAGRKQTIADEFNDAIRAKREGKSADFVRAIDKDSDISIKVIGADNQVLELEMPARHVLEQVCAKFGLPPWMLGLHWSTTERLANYETEMVLADVATRQAAKLPLFTRLVETMLQLRGRKWKKGDWYLEFETVNLHDEVARAQARFLNAQADMYYLQNAEAAGIDLDVADLAIGKTSGKKKP